MIWETKTKGVRIATTLAILLHDSGSSKSLLSHLGLKKGLRMVSTSGETKYAAMGNLTFVTIDIVGPCEFHPALDRYRKKIVPFKVWWETEMIFNIGNTHIHRKDLVLWARNKDGGAHVDSILHPLYERLVAGGDWGYVVKDASGKVLHQPSFDNAHLASLRQIGYGVLNTADFPM